MIAAPQHRPLRNAPAGEGLPHLLLGNVQTVEPKAGVRRPREILDRQSVVIRGARTSQLPALALDAAQQARPVESRAPTRTPPVVPGVERRRGGTDRGR